MTIVSNKEGARHRSETAWRVARYVSLSFAWSIVGACSVNEWKSNGRVELSMIAGWTVEMDTRPLTRAFLSCIQYTWLFPPHKDISIGYPYTKVKHSPDFRI